MGNRKQDYRGRRKRRNPLSSLLAVALAAVMAIGILPQYALPVYAADTSTANTARVSDGDTKDGYKQWLGLEDGTSSTQYNGRVWADKSVYTEDVVFSGDIGEERVEIGKDADFLIAYSALATSQEVEGQQPVDVVFVLDFSASMTWGVDSTTVSRSDGSDSRIQYMVEALNSAIQTLAEANPNNRVAIVTFNRVGSTLLPLTELSEENLQGIQVPEDGSAPAYLELTSFSGTTGKDDGKARVTCHIGSDRSAETDSKTNIQYGLYEGMSILSEETDTTFTLSNGSEVTRIPNVVLMSDGAPTTISLAENRGQWWNGLDYNGGESVGWGDNSNAWSANGFMPLLTASYMKNAITHNYYGDDPGENSANVYTIGFSTNHQTDQMVELANLVLNPEDNLAAAETSSTPEIRLIYNAWEEYSSNNSPTVHYVTESSRESHDLEVEIPNDNNNPDSLMYADEYFPAESSEDLNAAFSQIASLITSQAQVPTQVSGSDPVHDGYITYTDPIGAYMEVKDVKTILYSGQRFDRTANPVTETAEDGTSITTYTFSGEINSPVYGQHNVSEIQITVETTTDAAGIKSQTLTVKIPASAIPLRVNTITLDVNGEVASNTDNEAYPIRVLYTVGMQEGIIDENGVITDKVSSDYIAQNSNSDGTVNFYSNRYSGSDDGNRGDALVTFTPADSNPYYFVQEDTLLYTDEACQTPATAFDPEATYYFRSSYVQGEGENAQTVWYVVERSGSMLEGYTTMQNGQLYLSAGAPRLGNLQDSMRLKEENSTGTAAYEFYPTFTGDPSTGQFEIYLGNNGKLTADQALSLTIAKTVDASEGLTAPADTEFSFVLAADSLAGKTVDASKQTEGSSDTEQVSLQFDSYGEASFKLKAGQKLVISEMAGVTYAVRETDLPGGFTLSNVAVTGSGTNNEGEVTGTIASDTVVTFTNTYSVSDLDYAASGGLVVSKTLNGRDMEADEFAFKITGNDALSTAKLGKADQEFSAGAADDGTPALMSKFQDMTFTAGEVGETYTYTVQEVVPDNAVNPNVNSGDTVYSDASQTEKAQAGWTRNGIGYDSVPVTVEIQVEDNGDGTLYTITTVSKGNVETEYDSRNYNAEDAATIPTVSFVNTYSAGDVTIGASTDNGIRAQKTLNGRSWNEGDSFTFTLEPVTDGAPMPENASVTVSAEEGTQSGTSVTGMFGDITYTSEDLQGAASKAFEYTVTEEVPEDAAGNGITYDRHVSTVTVTVTDNGDGTLSAAVSYNNSKATTAFDQAVTSAAAFTNTYQPASVTLSGSTALQVTKKVAGADAVEAFTFELTLAEGNADAVQLNTGDTPGSIADGTTVIVENGLQDGESSTVSFGDLTFTEAGEYVFNVTEIRPETVPVGWTYDGSTKQITVNVTDTGNGQLTASVEDNNPTFLNTYFNPEEAKSVYNEDSTTEINGQLVGVGDILTYTIDWVNNAVDTNGAPAQANIVITDTVPAGTELVAGSISNEGAESGGRITWTFENQEPGASGTVSFRVRVTEDAVNNDNNLITNQADITIGGTGHQTNVVTNPVPEKQETSNPGTIGEGTVLTYQITFTNTDGEDADAVVADTLTKGQSYNQGSASVQINGGEAAAAEPDRIEGSAAEGQTLTWNLNNLPADAQVTLTFTVTVTRDAGASVDNTAAVNGHETNTVTTPYPSDSRKDVALADEPTISVDGGMAGVGDELLYTIDWAAEADGTLIITDTIPDGTEYVEGSADSEGVYEEATNTITWTFENLTEGDKGTATFRVEITEDAVNYDTIRNTAYIQIGEDGPKTATNEVTTDIPKKEVSDATPETGIQVGDTLTYTIEYRNDTDAAADVTVTDTLPTGLTLVESSLDETGSYDDETRTITWTIDNVQAGAEGAVSFSAKVNENALTVTNPLTNQAEVKVGENNHAYKTNTTDGQVEKGDLIVSKEITATAGAEIDGNRSFAFTIQLKDTSGADLTGSYAAQVYTAAGQMTGPAFTVSGADDPETEDRVENTFTLKHGEYIVITGLPEGALYEVTEEAVQGYTTTVPDNASGQINASETTVAFINVYTPDSVTVGGTGLQVTKRVIGAPTDAGFTFNLQLTSGNRNAVLVNTGDTPAVIPETGISTTVANGFTDGQSKTAQFGDLIFTEAGDYTFVVTEAEADGTVPAGWTYDNSEKEITVHVTDTDLNGQLEASIESDALIFVNSYEADSVTVGGTDLQVTKKVTGASTEAGFTFNLKLTSGNQSAVLVDVGDIPQAIEDTGVSTIIAGGFADGEEKTAQFGDLIFTEVGDYTFVVTEAEADGTVPAGWTYDNSEKEITVHVTDTDLDGQLEASIEGDALTFVNSYVPDSVTVGGTDLQVTKKVTGASTEVGFTFNLQLTDGNRNAVLVNTGDTPAVIPETGISTTVANGFTDGQSKTAQFGDLIFTEAGDYTFVVTEAEADGTVPAGWTYDNSEKEITVHVTDTDLDGQLEAEAEAADLTFTNSYAVTGTATLPGSTYLTVKKELVNIDWKAEAVKDGFTFLLSAGDDATQAAIDNGTIQMPAQTLTITAADEAADYAKSFGDIIFSAAGDYRFVITEQPGTDTNMDYDSHELVVEVHVRDNGQGGLSITTAVPEISGSSTFTNTYAPRAVSLAFSGQKILSGRDLQAGEFSFVLRDADGDVLATVQNDADGNIVFPALYYGMGDAGTYTYEISEVSGDLSGVIYDSSVVSVVVEVSYDPGTGLVTADCTMTRNGEDLGDSFTFTNSYAAPTEVGEVPDITAVKTVTPSDGNTYTLQADEFTFLLTPAETNPASDPIDGQTVTNDTAGNVIFAEDVVYTEAGTYRYTVRELSGSQPGILYDDTVYTITVVVEDSGDHQLDVTSFTITRNDGTQADAMTFENRYDPAQTSVILGGTKTLTGAALEENQFSFLLEAVTEGAPMPEAGPVAYNTASGSFAFGSIRYDAPGTYIYRISEVNNGLEGYTYDGTVYTVTVTVTDENGVLRAQTAIDGGGEIVFSNSYSPLPVTLSGETAVRGTKVLTGRELAAEEFSFQLLDAEGQVVSTAVNGADGSFVFGDLTFTEAGTYYYTVQEVNTGLGGVTYDTDTVYTVVITVEDAGGHLEAAVEYQNNGQTVDGAVFNNTYAAEGTAVRLSALKVLSGRTLEAGEFSFQLKDENGTVIAEAVNDASGAVTFPEIALNEAGTYHYTISEVQGSAEQVTYDNTVYGVTVTVSDNLEGNLTAEVAFDEGQIPVFQNVYTEAEEPAEPTPGTTDQPTQTPSQTPEKTHAPGSEVGAANTGDATPTALYVAGGTAGAALLILLIAAAAVRRRHARQQK